MDINTKQEEILVAHSRKTSQGIVRILKNVQEIRGIREFWSSCNGRLSAESSFYLNKDMNSITDGHLRIFVYYKDDNPQALMVGIIHRERFMFKFGWMSLFRPFVNVLRIRGGVLGDQSPDVCRRLVRKIIENMKKDGVDIVQLVRVEKESPLFLAAKNNSSFFFRDYFTPLRPHRRRLLPSNIEQFRAGLSRVSRRELRRIEKKLINDFPGMIRLECCKTADKLIQSLADIETISKKTWQAAMGSGFTISPLLLRNYGMGVDMGWTRIYILYLAEKPSAFLMGYLYKQTFYGEFTGYDPEYANYRPGLYLLLRVMEECCLEKAEAYDFGGSDEEYKKRYANLTWYEADIHLFIPTLKGFFLNLLKTVVQLFHESGKALAERLGYLQLVKKLWRK